MTNERRFDNIHGKGAFARLRSMLDDPGFAYQDIGRKFGLTRQRIAQIMNELGINGRHRQCERSSHREPRIIKQFKEYPSGVRAVMNKLRRAGLRVTPYNSPQPSVPNLFHTLLRMVVVSGVLCSIQVRKGHKLSPTNGREYARFDVNDATKRAKVALWAVKRGRTTRLYVVPLTHLRNVSSVYLPAEGNYVYRGRKPRKDWTRYEGAWHLLGERPAT